MPIFRLRFSPPMMFYAISIRCMPQDDIFLHYACRHCLIADVSIIAACRLRC